MKRRTVVAFALIASYLVVSTVPVTAASADLAVGSSHVGRGLGDGTLTGTDVVDVGDPYVVLGVETAESVFDGFEDGSTDGWTGHSDESFTGAQTSTVYNGSYGADLEIVSNGYDNAVTLDDANFSSGVVRFSAYVNSPSSYNHPHVVFREPETGDQYFLRANIGSGTLAIRKLVNGDWTTVASADATLTTDTWYNMSFKYDSRTGELQGEISDTNGVIQTVEGVDTDLSPTTAGVGSYQGTTYWDDVLSEPKESLSSGEYLSANHSVTNSQKAWANLTLDNASASVDWEAWDSSTEEWQVVNSAQYSSTGNYTLDTSGTDYDTWRVNVTFDKTGSTPTAQLHDEGVLFDDQQPSANETTAAPQGGETLRNENVTLSINVSDRDFSTVQGDSVDVAWVVDGSTVSTETISSNQTVSYSTQLADGDHSWHVKLADDYGETDTSSTFNFTVDHFEPTLDDSSMSPEDGAKLQRKDVTLSINVSDRDFSIDGDSVTAEFVVDGSVVGTDTLSSNGTATTTISNVDGGSHDWYVRVYDDYGSGSSSSPDATSATKTYNVPATLYIRPVNIPNELINGTNVTVTGRFFSGKLVFERETSNGKINFTDLPVDRTYVLVLETDDYYRRTVIITSLYEQNSAYLLNKSKSAYYTEFVLNDFTGEFSGSSEKTKLYIERAINTSSGLEWVTIAGDYFGAEGRFEADLQKDKRYRVRIVSDDNSSRILGAYTATRKGTIQLDVGEVTWKVDEPESIRHAASFENLTDEGEIPNGVVHFQYTDPAENTSELRVVIHQQGNESNEIMNSTFTEGYGTFSLNKTIESEQMDTQWVVDWWAFNASGDVIASSSSAADGQRYRLKNPFGPKWSPVILTTLFLFVGTIFGGRLSSIGALATTGVAAVTWWMGWYAASGGVVVFAGLIGVAFAVGGGGRR